MGSVASTVSDTMSSLTLVISAALLMGHLPSIEAGLLGAGHGAGSCAAFPNRTPSYELDHVAGCPRYAECCSEFGYCHSRDSWESGNFRDCNGVSNGQPLEGGVIREEAIEAAKGDGKVTPDFLGVSVQVWESQVNHAIQFLSSSSSSSSISSSSSSSSLSNSLSSSSISTSSLVAQILAVLQPQVSQAVQTALSTQKQSDNRFTSSSAQDTSSFSDSFSGSQISNFQDSSLFSNSQDSSFTSNSLDSSSFSNSVLDTSSISRPALGPSSQTSSATPDISALVSLIIKQLEPEIASAVQAAT